MTAADHKILPVTTTQPESHKVYPIAVIGSGAGGTMAAKRAILNNDCVLLFTGARNEMRRSRGTWVRKVDNIPGLENYERTVLQLRNETLTDLVNSPFGSNLYIIDNSVTHIEKDGDIFKLTDPEGNTFLVNYVILATGMMDEQPHINGSIKPILSYANRQTVAYCLLCDGHRSFGKNVVVIGHSESAAKGAILISEKYSPQEITILTNGSDPEFTEETANKLQEQNIEVIVEPIADILNNSNKGELAAFQLDNGSEVKAEMAFVLLGIRPNNELAIQLQADLDERGLVITDLNGESSVPNLFVIGDLRAKSMKQIYAAWQHAVDAALTINQRIRAKQ